MLPVFSSAQFDRSNGYWDYCRRLGSLRQGRCVEPLPLCFPSFFLGIRRVTYYAFFL
jgi:hypothetical protein